MGSGIGEVDERGYGHFTNKCLDCSGFSGVRGVMDGTVEGIPSSGAAICKQDFAKALVLMYWSQNLTCVLGQRSLSFLTLGDTVLKAHTACRLLPLLSGRLFPMARAPLGPSQGTAQFRLHTGLEASQENLKS